MLNLSYYDGLDPLLLKNKINDNTDLHLQKNGSSIFKLTNQHNSDLVKATKQGKYSPALLSQKIKEDMPKHPILYFKIYNIMENHIHFTHCKIAIVAFLSF